MDALTKAQFERRMRCTLSTPTDIKPKSASSSSCASSMIASSPSASGASCSRKIMRAWLRDLAGGLRVTKNDESSSYVASLGTLPTQSAQGECSGGRGILDERVGLRPARGVPPCVCCTADELPLLVG